LNKKLAEGKEEEFYILPLTGGQCNCIALEERVGLPSALIFTI
jgi:hypothetical protein